jgi:CHU_C Type IX secretion signal domain
MFLQTHLYRVKLIFAFICSVLSANLLFSQAPANDICSGAIPLSITAINDACPTTVYTNIAATDANGGINSPNPTCFNGLKAFKDVWFKFTTPATGAQNFRIQIQGVNALDSIKNPQVALYIGDCTVGLFEEYCATQVSSVNSRTLSIEAGNMRANTTYYLQVANYQSTDIGGKFSVCVKPFDAIYKLTLGTQTSTAGQGVLYDSGGPLANYGDNEGASSTLPANPDNYSFNIRPSASGCIELMIDSLGTEPNFDTLTIYDGRTGVLLDRISGTSTQSFTFQVPTNWVRVVFRSDESTTSRGFKLSWKGLSTCISPKATLCSAAEIIPSLPFKKQATTCNDRLDGVTNSACANDEFLDGKDHIYKFTSNGGQCLKISLTNFLTSSTIGLFGRPTGINVGVYRNCPSESTGECVAIGKVSVNRDTVVIGNTQLELPGDYYIVVTRREACTPFTIQIDTVPCLNRLPNAGFCSKALSLNDCSNQVTSDIVLDLTSQGDSSFIKIDPPSVNAGCIGGLGFVPGIDTPRFNYVFMTFKAQKDGKFGFTLSPIVNDNNSDADFNIYGPIDDAASICTYAKTNAPIRSSYGVERTVPNRTTGLMDSYVNTLGTNIIVTDTCEQGLGDGVVKRLDVKKGKYYLIWINDYKGTIGRSGVRLNFGGSTNGVLDSLADPLSSFVAGNDTVIYPGKSAQLNAKGGLTYTWTPATSLNNAAAANPIATPAKSTSYKVNIQGTCREVTRTVKVDVFEVKKFPDATVCKGEELTFNAGENYPASTGAIWRWTSPSSHLAELSCNNCNSPIFKATNTSSVNEVHTFIVTLQTPTGNLADTFLITVTPGAVANYSVLTAPKTERDTNTCLGIALNLLKPGFDATATYTWSATNPGNTLNVKNPSVSPSISTKYYVTVTGGAGGCPANSVDSVIVRVYQPPVLLGIADATTCAGNQLVMGTSAIEDATTYSWTPSNGLDKTNVPNPTLTVQTGINNYLLTATNLGGCVSKDTIKITGVNLSMKIDAPDSIRHCKGSPLTLKSLTTPAGLAVRWNSDRDFSVTDSSISVAATPLRVTRYFASVSQPGCTRLDTVTVYVDSLPFNTNILPQDTVVCMGAEIIFRSTVYEPVLFPKITFKWKPTLGQLTSDTLYNLVIQADTAVQKYYREMNIGVCKRTDSVSLKVNPIPIITLIPKDTLVCTDDLKPIVLNASANNPNAKDWKWTDSNGQEIPGSKDKQTISVTPSSGTPNMYKVTAKVGDCPGSATTTITVAPAPTILFPTQDALCLGDSIKINSSPNNTFTHTWSSSPAGLSSTLADPGFVKPLVTTTYSVNLVSPNGCKRTLTKELKVATGTLTTSPDVSACTGDPVTLTAMGVSNIGGAYSWSSSQTTATINPTVTSSGNYTVTFTYGGSANCKLQKSIKVTAIPGFTVKISPDTFANKLVDQGNTLALTSALTGNFTAPTFLWKANDKDAGTTQNITAVALDPTNTYSVKVNSTTGCSATAQIVVNVRIPNFEIPNAFTPNGDNVNATFNIEFDPENKSNSFNIGNPKPRFWKGNIIVESFQVFNRWGAKVYEEVSQARLNDKTYKGWDGKKSDTELPSDVYVYIIKLKMPDGTSKTVSGELNLIR